MLMSFVAFLNSSSCLLVVRLPSFVAVSSAAIQRKEMTKSTDLSWNKMIINCAMSVEPVIVDHH